MNLPSHSLLNISKSLVDLYSKHTRIRTTSFDRNANHGIYVATPSSSLDRTLTDDMTPRGPARERNTTADGAFPAPDTSPLANGEWESTGCMLSCAELLDKIIYALENKEPLSVIGVGQTEAFVMAQYTIFSEQDFMQHGEARVANMGVKSGFAHRGIRFPNVEARDMAVDAVRNADIVGYNTIVDSARKLTEQVFAAYNLNPPFIFEANLRRVFMFSQPERFEDMLRGRKILLISSLAPTTKTAMEEKYKDKLGLEVVGAISIYEYEEIPRVKQEIADYDFDLCLLAAGVNAVILAPYIARTYGKVAFDIGSGMHSLSTGQVVTDSWLTHIIGIDNLFKM